MCRGKKVILFAPTYRGRNKKTAYYPYELIDFEKLYQICGDEYVVLFKMHPWVNKDIVIGKKYADKFLDVKKYPNINDLFYIVDLLITDYSSNIFEYSLMRNRCCFLHSTRFSILFPEDFIEIMKNLHRVRYVIHLRRCFLQLQIRTLNMKKLNNISHIILII